MPEHRRNPRGNQSDLDLASIMVQAIDALSIGVVITNEDGRVLLANRAARAIMAARDGIHWCGDRIAASGSTFGKALAIAREKDVTLVVPRSSGLLDYQVRLRSVGALRLIRLADPSESRPNPAALKAAYGLTAAEAEVASSLAAGSDLRQVAQQRGVHLETCRKQLRRIFEKVGVRRQSDLVRVLGSGVLTFGVDENMGAF